VQINVTGEVLTIKGEVKEKEEVQEKAYYLREQRWGMFERTIALPTDVIADKAKAEFENGILTITLPKAEEVRPKTISIKTK
jgi:HSP20 family protein